jgi:hypothetical protein
MFYKFGPRLKARVAVSGPVQSHLKGQSYKNDTFQAVGLAWYDSIPRKLIGLT